MSKSLIFITGGTGFIGAEVVHQALEAGYRVRLSVRKPEQETIVKERYPKHVSDIETVIIPDITKRGSFDTALDDVDYIIHLASPIPGKGMDLRKDFIEPAVGGTEAILYAALKFPNVKTVVVTSSAIGIMPIDAPLMLDHTIKENSGEVFSTEINVESIDPQSGEGQSTMYRVSKVMAHQATRDFLKREKPAYKLLTTHPVFVVGESKIQSSAAQIDAVNSMLWSSIQEGTPFASPVFVDVKDCATAHVRAIVCSAPSGTEFNHCNPDPEFSWNEIAEFVKQEYPQLNGKLESNWKGPVAGVEAVNVEKYLDLQWRPWKQTLRELIDQQSSF